MRGIIEKQSKRVGWKFALDKPPIASSSFAIHLLEPVTTVFFSPFS